MQYSDTFEKLYKEGELKRAQASIERQHILSDKDAEHSFRPLLNQQTEKLTANREEKDGATVFDRLQVSESRHFMEAVLSTIKTELELKNCTFSPKVNNSFSGGSPVANRETGERERRIRERRIRERERRQ